MNIKITNLKHVYQSPASEPRQVLDISSWEIASGQAMLLRGVSGSGKTTLFNVISGLLQPTSGDVFFDDQSLYALKAAERDRFRAQSIGYIFQTHHLLAPLTAIENIVMPMAFAEKFPRKLWRSRAQALLAAVGLPDFGAYRPAQLSTGQRLRVAVARALANDPPLLLADEPTAALDPEAAIAVTELIRAKSQENNAILIVSSHDPALNDQFSMIAHLQHGVLSLEETQSKTLQEK